MKVRKAVIPAAGYGTRMMPASKSVPKEMFPIVDKPAIHYIVEEAFKSGIEDILIITNRGKVAIEDYFDRSPEIEATLQSPGKESFYDAVLESANFGNVFFLRQKVMKGLGHAVRCAKAFTGNEPFVVLYGDDVIMGDDPVVAQLIRAYDEFERPCLGIKEVSSEAILKYSSLAVEPIRDNLFRVTDMIEKPKADQVLSLYSILGRVLLTPEIYDILDEIPLGAGGELQLTDAIKVIAQRDGCIGVDFFGQRYDMGSKLGALQASIETALRSPDLGESFREYLTNLLNN